MPPWVVVGPGDDAAVVAPPRGALEVLTTDTLVDGVHFDSAFVPGTAIGHRALAVNLSDLAAMGATPRCALLSLALPAAMMLDRLDGFTEGLRRCATRAGVTIVGGNITNTAGPWSITIALVGTARPRRILTRRGAHPGDGVYVTGSLGAAAVGLERLRRGDADRPDAAPTDPCVARYLQPEARVGLGRQLAHHRAASSCMDLSDGLADGVRQLAEASQVGMVIDADAIPIATEVRTWCQAHGTDPVELALSGGDDYELLFTVRPRHGGRLRGATTRGGQVPITRIGRVTSDRDVRLARSGVMTALPTGFEHFR